MTTGPIRTACPYCGVGCGVSATRTGERSVLIKGDTTHPANGGRLCSKGTHLGETVSLEGRLLHPEIGGHRADWDTALDLVAARFSDSIARHGPDSVAFYVSGQLLTEDYYVANKLMKGFIGSSNIDTNSRLCMASAVAAHNRAFGEDIVPCSYSDLEEADLIILVGSNTAWCHPVIWQRIEAAREKRGTKLVVIDPRRTETAERADLHLAIKPDGDVALFQGLLATMRHRGKLDEVYLANHVSVPENFWDDICCSDIAGATGLDQDVLAEFYGLFEEFPRTVTLFSQGSNQSACGTDKGNAIINVHLATGRIGKPGAGPFSMTGQPNAMGGREVGGLANMLAAHMGFSDEERAAAQDFWASPTIAPGPGLKAVDMFKAVHDGRIKALWIMATNPAVSMPDANFVREALKRCNFVVVSDCIAETDSATYAHVKLPALGWGEKDGTVTNSERVISRQRPIFPPPSEARADWDIISDVARRMGFAQAFDYTSPASVFREYAAQTGFRNGGKRLLDISQWAEISDADYGSWKPWQWGGPSPLSEGRYSTPDGKARLVPVKTPQAETADHAFPLRLNTGRYRDQWHTMTRTGLSPKLSQHRREPWVEIHPEDAARFGIENYALARIATASGESLYRAMVTDSQREGELFVPMHWTDQISSGGRTGRLPGQKVDLVSGQPAFKNTSASIAPYGADWRGFIVSRDRPDIAADCYWTRVRGEHGWLVELAGHGAIDIEALLPQGERIEAQDAKRGTLRVAVRDEAGVLKAALFLTRSGTLPPRDWILAQLGAEEGAQGSELLAGRAASPAPDAGPVVCVCFDIGAFTIVRAIREQALTSVEAIGKALNAGTNCGSCRPAIAKLLSETVAEPQISDA
ncbi:MAG: molybdopterin-dependent oxidoreductase [Sphingomonadaceae bacterium]